MTRLAGKVAVITGGASGIGEASVRRFVAEGAQVVVADIQDEAGERLAGELGDGVVYQRTDVTEEAAVEAVVARAVDAFGRLDVMFNNAGALVGRGSVLEVTAEEFDRTMALLFRSVFFGMKHAGRVLTAQGSGTILSTASIAGLLGGGGPHLYATAKAAVIHLTKCVALELGESGVRVNCICPGGVATPLVLNALGLGEEARESVSAGMAGLQAMRRAGMPDDIAKAAVWLASDDADYVTGQALAVDGGEGTGPAWSKQTMQ